VTPEGLSVRVEVGWLVLEKPDEAFKPGEIHARRERCSDRDSRDPEQPLADTHLIPGVAPRCERRLQGRPERRQPLLGKETNSPNLPCAISVPNLMTDRGFGVAGLGAADNVRRLMYQTLIWAFALGDDPRSLRAAFDAEDGERLANPLVDGVRGDVQLGRDFLRREQLVDELEAVELTGSQPRHAFRHWVAGERT